MALVGASAMGLGAFFGEAQAAKPAKKRNPQPAKPSFSPFRRDRYDQRAAEIAAWNKEVDERNRAKRAAKNARSMKR